MKVRAIIKDLMSDLEGVPPSEDILIVVLTVCVRQRDVQLAMKLESKSQLDKLLAPPLVHVINANDVIIMYNLFPSLCFIPLRSAPH